MTDTAGTTESRHTGSTVIPRHADYDSNAAVPAAAALIRQRLEHSRRFRARHPGHLDIPYGPLPANKWDIYPAADPTAPCLAFVHGGYWQRNDRQGFATVAEGLHAHGWSVALPGHTLAPEASLTRIVAEIRAAIGWLARHGDDHGAAGPIVVSGWSSGAHLISLALDLPGVIGGLAVSGVYELRPLTETGFGAALALTPDEIAGLSPLHRPVGDTTPLTVAYGTAELPALIGDSAALHAHRIAAGAPSRLLPVEGADHFTILEEFRRPGGVLVGAALDIVRAHRHQSGDSARS
ncbi:alpha/beta hydrolase [Nocardia sp. NPDC024068]|uniref:alpha/beta hydrolase n=1 Tax=Nocardia sp. NPDC024068 TaxID=3157197 RepID=UPI0033F25D1F